MSSQLEISQVDINTSCKDITHEYVHAAGYPIPSCSFYSCELPQATKNTPGRVVQATSPFFLNHLKEHIYPLLLKLMNVIKFNPILPCSVRLSKRLLSPLTSCRRLFFQARTLPYLFGGKSHVVGMLHAVCHSCERKRGKLS